MAAPKNRYEHREEVLIALAVLFQPLREMMASRDFSQLPSVRAAFFHNYDNFWNDYILPFSVVNRVSFSAELEPLRLAINHCRNTLTSRVANDPIPSQVDIAIAEIDECLERAKASIRSIPCDVPGFILDANTPFQAYCRLRAIVQGAAVRVDLLDPYLDAEVYHCYPRRR